MSRPVGLTTQKGFKNHWVGKQLVQQAKRMLEKNSASLQACVGTLVAKTAQEKDTKTGQILCIVVAEELNEALHNSKTDLSTRALLVDKMVIMATLCGSTNVDVVRQCLDHRDVLRKAWSAFDTATREWIIKALLSVKYGGSDDLVDFVRSCLEEQKVNSDCLFATIRYRCSTLTEFPLAWDPRVVALLLKHVDQKRLTTTLIQAWIDHLTVQYCNTKDSIDLLTKRRDSMVTTELSASTESSTCTTMSVSTT
jgi:hypothetical protein